MNTIEEAARRLAHLQSSGVDTPPEPATRPATSPLEVGTEQEVAAPEPEVLSHPQAQSAGKRPAPSQHFYDTLTPPSTQSLQAAARTHPQIPRMSSERWRMDYSLLLSLLIHGLLLSLTFSGQGRGLPGLSFPWQERRVEVPELRVVLAPAPVTRAPPAVNSVAGPVQPASTEPPVASGRASTPPALPGRALEIAPSTKSRAEARPERNAVTPAAPAKASTRPDESTDTVPAKIPQKTTPVDVAPSVRPKRVVPPVPTGPDVITAAPSASSPETVLPAHRDSSERIGQDVRERAAALAKQADQFEAARIEAAKRENNLREEAARAEAARVEAKREEAAQLAAARVEAERQETARQEAAARIEAARRAAAQSEAERLLAARQEAARVETARAAQLEAERQEAVRQEAAARIEAARRAAAQLEAERQLAARQETPRVEATPTTPPARAEATPTTPPARVEATPTPPTRVEATPTTPAARVEAAPTTPPARAEATPTTPPQAQLQEPARQERPRAEAARPEAERQEPARAPAPQEVARGEAEKEEAVREARRRAIGRQLDEEAAKREAAAKDTRQLPLSLSTARRARLWGRVDPNVALVQYAEGWARKIQFNTPVATVREVAKQPHRQPMVTVAIRSDGSVESVTFVVSSGVAQVDDAIRRIVKSHEHYPAFPPALAREYDVIEIRRTWHFDDAVGLY